MATPDKLYVMFGASWRRITPTHCHRCTIWRISTVAGGRVEALELAMTEYIIEVSH